MLPSRKGYNISIGNKENNVLIVQAWGVWDAEDKNLAKDFRMGLQDKVREISASEKEWSVCEDLVELRPQSKEICRIMGDGIVFAIKHGMNKAVHLES